VAAHDLNYIAESGMLSLVSSVNGSPGLPPALIADIAGGSYPVLINVLMALLQRQKTGKGCYLDIGMAENVLPFLYSALAQQQLTGIGPVAGGEMTTGGTARYQIYRTADDRFLTVAPVEDRFWSVFCDVVGLPDKHRAEIHREDTIRFVADRIAEKTAEQWLVEFEGRDVCVAAVKTVEQALRSEHFRARGVFEKRVQGAERQLIALPVPISDCFRDPADVLPYPLLNEAEGSDGWDAFTPSKTFK
jgi:crotonobetainyl-CoA:carnitine CoA-transferase CaiB-like acyl-CoA transferase